MSKRINHYVLFMVAVLLLCEIGLAIAGDSYRLNMDDFSAGSCAQEQSLSQNSGVVIDESGTPELVSVNSCGSLFSIRSQTNGNNSQRSNTRTLLLFILLFCFFTIASHFIKFRRFCPKMGSTSSNILFFIHRKDGKK